MLPLSPINFLDHYVDSHKQRVTVRKRAVALALVALATIVLSSHSLRAPFLSARVERVISTVEQFNFFHLATSADQKLSGEETGRINILLLGIGGGKHDGALLTDTIILGSIDLMSKKIALLSVPRDMVVPVASSQWRKINSVHAIAEMNDGTGMEAIRKTMEEITGQTIPYVVRLDFDGFVQLVDAMGGLSIDVERTLDDPMYPIEGREEDPVYAHRYERLVIEKGLTLMDGELALKYVRSRHGRGEEGSDFARARRQQKILQTIKQEVFSLSTVFSPRRLKAIEEFLSTHIATNLQPWEALRLKTIGETLNTDRIIHEVLDDGPQSILTAGTGLDGAYILTPRAGNFDQLIQMEKNIFSTERTFSTSAPPTALPTLRNNHEPSVSLLNGTSVEGYATRVAQKLKAAGVNLQTINNAPVKGYEESFIYLNGGPSENDPIVQLIQAVVPATITTVLPSWASTSSAQIIIVLGIK